MVFVSVNFVNLTGSGRTSKKSGSSWRSTTRLCCKRSWHKGASTRVWEDSKARAGWSCFEQTYKSGGTVRLTCVDQTVRGLEWNPCRCAEGQKVLPLCKSLGCKGLHASQLRNWSRRRNWVKTYRVHSDLVKTLRVLDRKWAVTLSTHRSSEAWNSFVRTWRRPGVQNWHSLLEDRSAWTFTMTVWIDVTFPIKRIDVECIKQDSNKLFSMERYLQISTNH